MDNPDLTSLTEEARIILRDRAVFLEREFTVLLGGTFADVVCSFVGLLTTIYTAEEVNRDIDMMFEICEHAVVTKRLPDKEAERYRAFRERLSILPASVNADMFIAVSMLAAGKNVELDRVKAQLRELVSLWRTVNQAKKPS